MLIRLAWNNIWRHRIRSILVIAAIVAGAWAGIFTMAFYFGLNGQRVNDKIRHRLSHLQIHHPDFISGENPGALLPPVSQLAPAIEALPELAGYSPRISLYATAASARGTAIVQLIAVDPEKEKKVTDIHSSIIQGNYFEEDKKVPLVIGSKLAHSLRLEPGDGLVLDFQFPGAELQSLKGRITGIYKTDDSRYDGAVLFTTREAFIRQGFCTTDDAHEIGVLLKSSASLPGAKAALSALPAGAQARTWAEIAPDLAYIYDYLALSMGIFMGVIMVAVAFVIINTMLMAVLERARELGMLMAVGMNRKRIFGMIQMETLFIALAAGPLGALLGWLTVKFFSRDGIDLSALSDGLSAFGVSEHVIPVLETKYYVLVALLIIVTAAVAAMYPSWRAVRLHPSQAVSRR